MYPPGRGSGALAFDEAPPESLQLKVLAAGCKPATSESIPLDGMVVIAIQAAEVERRALEQWAKEQGIAVPVGSIQGDAEKATFAWGVRSLPWLILTDATHIVRAEGFAVNELDGKIETVKP